MRQTEKCAALTAALLAFVLLGCEPHYPVGYEPPDAAPDVVSTCPDQPCESGLACVDGVCVAQAPDSGPAVCPEAACADGLVCENGVCVVPPPADAGSPACVTMCHRPDTSAEAPHETCVDQEAVEAHRSHGDTLGDCQAPPPDDGTPPDDGGPADQACADGKTAICHVPPGDPANAHTICVGAKARKAHLDHGDTLGPCGQTATVVMLIADAKPAFPNLKPLFDAEHGYKVSYSDLVFRPDSPAFQWRFLPLHGQDVPKLPKLPKQRLPLHSPKK